MQTLDGAAMERQRWAALVECDLNALDRLFGKDLTYTHSNGMVDTKATYLGALRDGVFRYTSVDLEELRSQTFGATSVVTGLARVTTDSKAGELVTNLRYTAVWAPVEGSWQFVCWHSCGVSQ